MAELQPEQPIYSTPEPNEKILLSSEEDVEILLGDIRKEGKANICQRFLPEPQLIIESTFPNALDVYGKIESADNVTLHFLSWGIKAEMYVIQANPSEPLLLTLSPLREPITIANASTPQLQKVIFHLLNFHDFLSTTDCRVTIEEETKKSLRRLGGVSLVADNWQITLTAMPSTHSIVEKLKESGGYAITHVGKIERKNKEAFSANQGEGLLRTLYYFLSFARGFETSPILPVGFDSHGKQVWCQWGTGPLRQYQPVRSWFSRHHGKLLIELFPKFLKRWQDDVWKGPLEEAVYWYLMGNTQAGGIDGATILTQAALELLAWTYVVKDRDMISEKGFKRLWASDKLRLLLTALDIPCEIPDRLTELKAFAKSVNAVNAPHALTELRNTIVHPDQNSKRESPKVAFEGWMLGLWYIELTLLRLFGHDGIYGNRLTQEWIDDVEKVPWAT